MENKFWRPLFDFFFIFLLIFSPLFYGGIRTGPFITIQLALFFLAILFIFYLLTTGYKLIFPAQIYLLIIFTAVIIFQIIPLPGYLIKIISPKTSLLYKQYADFSDFSFHHLSLYGFSTKQEIIHFISLMIAFVIAINIFIDKRQFERIILIIIFLSLALSLYGITKKYFILGKEATGSFSTFGNRNHFADYMVMVVSLTTGYALSCRNKFKKFIFSFIGAIIAASILLSLSRAGALSFIFSFILMFFLLHKEKIIKGNYWVISMPVILGIFFLLIAGFEPLRNRLTSSWASLGGRLSIFEDAFKMIKDFPLFGVGFGNFEYVFTMYQKSAYSVYYKYLHNDHLQLIIETGLIGAFFYFIFLFAIFRDILLQLNKRHDLFAKNIIIGGFCGLCGVIAHSFLDFNFHIPAVSLLFWFILGLIYKCSYAHFYQMPTDNI